MGKAVAPNLSHKAEQELITAMAGFSKDPYGWVLFSFTWGEGELADRTGPEDWQKELLCDIRDGLRTVNEAILIAISSGHGIGKSAFVAWIILWALSTFADTKGVVTANTARQLETKTWPELAKWHRLFIASHWFIYTATSLYSADEQHQKTWRIDAIPWSETNTEAFAGLHNQGKRIVLIFDEASAIADKVWDVAEGALTDKNTEIIWAAFGNPTRSTGRFFDCFNRLRHRWRNRRIDSRTVSHTNKTQIQKWVDDYGEDSDFVKVRVRGIHPATSDRQFISTNLVDQAKGKHLRPDQYAYAPKILGVDPAIYGDDEFVIVLRQGLMSKVLATYRKVQDDFILAGYVAHHEKEEQADAVFVDFGYGTGIVSAGRQMGRQWVLIPFGGASSKPEYLNKRAEMWGDMRTWLKEGGALPPDDVLAQELTGPEYIVNTKGQTQLEKKEDMKARGLASPNRGDALCLTFAFPVQKKTFGESLGSRLEFAKSEYDLTAL